MANQTPSGKHAEAFRLLQHGLAKQALPLLEDAVLKDPADSQARFLAGVCRFRIGDFSRSEGDLRGAVSLNPHHYLAHFYLGLALERQGRIDQALAQYGRSLAINPGFAEARKKLGMTEPGPGAAPRTSEAPPFKLPATGPGGVAHPVPLESRVARDPEKSENVGPGRELYRGHSRLSSFADDLIAATAAAALSIMVAALYAQHPSVPWFLPAVPALGVCVLAFGAVWLRARLTRYAIYERRLDFEAGVLFRQHDSVWLYEITNTSYRRSPLELLTNNATLMVEAQTGTFAIRGLRNAAFTRQLWDELRDAVLDQRRAMKSWWI